MAIARATVAPAKPYPSGRDKIAWNLPITKGLNALFVVDAGGFVDLIDGHRPTMFGGWTSKVYQGAPALVHDGAATCYAQSTNPRYLIGDARKNPACTLVIAFSAATSTIAAALAGSSSDSDGTRRLTFLAELYNNTGNLGVTETVILGDWDSTIPSPNDIRSIVAYDVSATAAGVRTRQGKASTTFATSNNAGDSFTLGAAFRFGVGIIDPLPAGSAIYFAALYNRILGDGEVRALFDNPRILVIDPIEYVPFLNSAQTAAGGDVLMAQILM